MEKPKWPTRPSPMARASAMRPRTISIPPSAVIGTADSPVPAWSKAITRTPVRSTSSTSSGWRSIFQVSTPPLAISTGPPGAPSRCTGTGVVPPRYGTSSTRRSKGTGNPGAASRYCSVCLVSAVRLAESASTGNLAHP